MRKLFFLATLMIAAGVGLYAQTTKTKKKDNLSLKVDLTSIKYPVLKLLFSYYNTSSKARFIDSADISTNKIAIFNTSIDEPMLAQLRVVPDKGGDTSRKARMIVARDIYSIYIEPGKLQLVARDSISNSVVTGSAAHKDYLILKEQASAFDPTFKSLYDKYNEARKNKDTDGIARLTKSLDSLEDIVNDKVYLSFIKSNGKTSPVALYALAQYAGYAINPVKSEPVFEQLGDAIKNLPAGKIFRERLDLAKKTEVGQYALPFTQKDTAGVDVSLASFKGKYVLMDFWASWCGPCRAENPNVVKAFNKYKDKGFTVLGISLDQPGAREKWIKAIYDDQLSWTQVSDLKYWNNDVAKLYGIEAIPQNYLLDADGKIIAKNIRGEALEKTLDGIFAGKNATN